MLGPVKSAPPMLESSSLLFAAWALPEAGPAGWTRAVHDAASHAFLGTVRVGEPARKAWFSWLRPYRLEVLETADAALLLTLVRSRSLMRLWDLYDAEEWRVGSLYPPVLLDADGVRRGFTQILAPDRGEVRSPAGHLLAGFEITAGQAARLTFAPDLEANPFLRMLLVANVLTLQLPPLYS